MEAVLVAVVEAVVKVAVRKAFVVVAVVEPPPTITPVVVEAAVREPVQLAPVGQQAMLCALSVVQKEPEVQQALLSAAANDEQES